MAVLQQTLTQANTAAVLPYGRWLLCFFLELKSANASVCYCELLFFASRKLTVNLYKIFSKCI